MLDGYKMKKMKKPFFNVMACSWLVRATSVIVSVVHIVSVHNH